MTAAALPIAATLPLTIGGGAMPAAAAAAAAASSVSSVIPPGPATVLHHGPTPWDMADNLGGALCEAPKVCKEVKYDWIQPYGPIEFGVKENVARLDWAIDHVRTDPKIVYAFSGGARIASVWLQDHAKDKDAPAPEDLSFVLLGNGGRKYGGVNGWFWGDLLRTPTDTQYDIVDVAGEYDPIADFPTNPFNLLAVANGVAAFVYVHLRYDEVDLDDPDNIVWKEGKTTYVYAPTEHLPLLQGFYDLGLGSLVADIEPKLREIVDKAYDRTWLEGKPTLGEQAAGASGSVATPDKQVRAVVRTPDIVTADTGTEKPSTEKPDTEKPDIEKPGTGTPDGAESGEEQASEADTTPEVTPDSGSTPVSDVTGDTDGADAAGGKHRMPLRGILKAAAEKAAAAKADKSEKADTSKTPKTDKTDKTDKSPKTEKSTASSSPGGGAGSDD